MSKPQFGSTTGSSQEIGYNGLIIDGALGLVLDRVERLERVLEVLVDLEHGRNVATSVAIVGRRPDGDQVLVLEPELVALHDELMGASNEADAINVIEFRGDLSAEQPSGTARGNRPGLAGQVLRVRPHEIAERTLVRDLLLSINESNLVEGLDLGRQAAMHAVNFIFDDSADGKMIEDLHGVLPRIGVAVLAGSLFVEAVERRGATRLMVTSEQSDVAGVLDLEADQELHGLDRVETTVDVVAHENVFGVWDLAATAEQLAQIVELAVNVTADDDGHAHRLAVALLDEDFFDLLADHSVVALRQRLAGPDGL